MKRKLLLMLLCAALGLGAAQAEVYRVESEADVPAAKGAIAGACMRRWMDMASRN